MHIEHSGTKVLNAEERLVMVRSLARDLRTYVLALRSRCRLQVTSLQAADWRLPNWNDGILGKRNSGSVLSLSEISDSDFCMHCQTVCGRTASSTRCSLCNTGPTYLIVCKPCAPQLYADWSVSRLTVLAKRAQLLAD